MTPSKCDQLFSAAEHLCPVAISKPYQESSPSGSGLSPSRGANNLRQTLKKMLKKAVRVSSVLSSIAANHIKLYRKHDSSGEKNLKLLFNKRVKTDI